MIIDSIKLSNFRNFRSKAIKFSPKKTVVIGPNASGKSNVLEAIFLLSTGKSFRARVEEEMVNYKEEIARVKGKFSNKEDKESLSLEVVLTRGKINIGTTRQEKVARKRLLVNGVGKRLIDFAGNFKVVFFGPEDLELVTESPSLRRRFLDTVLYQVDREYRRALLSYEKGLRQRNKLLMRIREEGLSRSQLIFWNKLLIKNGDYISEKREDFIRFINEAKSLDNQQFSLEYDKSAISEGRLEQYKNEEIAAATTLVGPHRDDFCFFLKKNVKARDISRYGSRGEQRMAILWLKLAELLFIERKTSERPTLLLDDIFSELDHEHKDIVTEVIRGQQTIVTTADSHFIEQMKRVEKVNLKG